jgi:hypothetical protein
MLDWLLDRLPMSVSGPVDRLDAHGVLHVVEIVLLTAITIDIAYMILRKPRKRSA